MSVPSPAQIAATVAGLHRWLETMRVTWPVAGYGGPVVHWWNHALAYRGAGLDWRYEGIVDGYLALWLRTADDRWLECAIRAGNDLIDGQVPDGHFSHSCFERNPGTGGTPHEAACDIALLQLGAALASRHDPRARISIAAAERNLDAYFFTRLWHQPSATLWDQPGFASFVPNKAATFVEAVLLLSDLTGDPTPIERYAVPTGEHILAMQVRQPASTLDGAIAQNRIGQRINDAYFPLYIARCIPALAMLGERTGDPRFRVAVGAAARFIARHREPDGGLPQVLYPNGRWNRAPRWVAGAGDIVRALTIAAEAGWPVDPAPTVRWIVRGARPDGHIATAEGFGRIVPWLARRDRFADDLGVVGWCDKAFRALAPLADPAALNGATARTRQATLAAVGGERGAR